MVRHSMSPPPGPPPPKHPPPPQWPSSIWAWDIHMRGRWRSTKAELMISNWESTVASLGVFYSVRSGKSRTQSSFIGLLLHLSWTKIIQDLGRWWDRFCSWFWCLYRRWHQRWGLSAPKQSLILCQAHSSAVRSTACRSQIQVVMNKVFYCAKAHSSAVPSTACRFQFSALMQWGIHEYWVLLGSWLCLCWLLGYVAMQATWLLMWKLHLDVAMQVTAQFMLKLQFWAPFICERMCLDRAPFCSLFSSHASWVTGIHKTECDTVSNKCFGKWLLLFFLSVFPKPIFSKIGYATTDRGKIDLQRGKTKPCKEEKRSPAERKNEARQRGKTKPGREE